MCTYMEGKKREYIHPHIVSMKMDIEENCMLTESIAKTDDNHPNPPSIDILPGMATAPEGWYSEEEDFPMD